MTTNDDTVQVPPVPPSHGDGGIGAPDPAPSEEPAQPARTFLPWLIAVVSTLIALGVGFALGRVGTSAAQEEAATAQAELDAAAATQQDMSVQLEGLSVELSETLADREAVQAAADETATELAATQESLDQAQADLAAAEEAAMTAKDRVQGAAEQAQEDALAAAEDELSARSDELDALAQELVVRGQELDDREAELDQRAADLAGSEAAAESTTFGNGTWEVGVDIVAGKYKTPGSDDICYWAKFSSDDGQMMDNHLGEGPQTVVIETGILFESSRCGTWTLVVE